MDTVTLKRNDTAPALEATVTDENGPVDLTGATAVVFKMATATESGRTLVPGALVLTGTGSLVDAASGVVQYDWVPGDTATSGRFFGEFEVTLAGGKLRTFPTLGYISITITDDL